MAHANLRIWIDKYDAGSKTVLNLLHVIVLHVSCFVIIDQYSQSAYSNFDWVMNSQSEFGRVW